MALYLVTTLADEAFDGSETGCAPDGAGLSLREALTLANADPESRDEITFDAGLKGGTLTLTQGELVISGNTNIDADIDDDQAFDITIDAAPHFSRGIHVTTAMLNADVVVEMDGLRITGGFEGTFIGGSAILVDSPLDFFEVDLALKLTNSQLDGNFAAPSSSALFFEKGSLSLDNVAIVDNSGGGVFLSDGRLTISNSTVGGNSAHGIWSDYRGTVTATNALIDGNGGRGIIVYEGGVDLRDSVVSNNDGGGIFGGTNSETDIYNSTIRGNAAERGGGIYAGIRAGFYIRESTIIDNTATAFGGGIYLYGNGFDNASALISNSRIEGNSAPVGGGAFVAGHLSDGRLASPYFGPLGASEWVGNHATFAGGAIALGSAPAAHDPGETLRLRGSLLAGNTADGIGGAIANIGGDATLTNVTLTENAAAHVGGLFADHPEAGGVTRVENSILAGNTQTSPHGAADSSGPLTLVGGNIVGDTAFVGTTPVRTGITPATIFAQGSGVPPGTLFADLGNPALDAGDDSLAPDAEDITGNPRLVDLPGVANNGANVVDLGAYELQELPPAATTITVFAAGESFQGNPAFSLYVDGALVAADVAVLSPAGPRKLPELRRAAVPLEFEVDGPVEEIEIVFANDAKGPGGDRNLFIREVAVDELILTPKRHGDFDPDGQAKPNIVNAAENHGLIYVNGTLTLTLPEDTLV